MPLAVLLRRAWVGLLSVLPGPVLRRLDDWARRKAQARAERRRRALQAARQQG